MFSVTVSFQGKDTRVDVTPGSSIADILKKLRINRETVIVSKNRQIVPDTEKITKNDSVDIVRITSGG